MQLHQLTREGIDAFLSNWLLAGVSAPFLNFRKVKLALPNSQEMSAI
jgi:hypothetical protein